LTTALVIFSRLPKAEAALKTITGKADLDEKLWNNLYVHTRSIAEASFLPVFSFTENEQQGNSFAEKIIAASETIFNKGFDNIILIGADTPGLKASNILNAEKELAAGKMIVAGPDKRGGIFLLGLNKKAFCKKAFLQFGWQTRSLFSEIKKYAAGFSHTFFTSALQDINNCNDAFLSANAYLGNSSWHTLLYKYIKKKKPFLFNHFVQLHLSVLQYCKGLRAPPFVAAL
jgi:glycosyltransferase A (GT-A) superfamily protein (DUF2064 family)